MNFKDQCVLVTVASRGIGRAVAIAFAKQGSRVAVHFHHNHAAAEQTLRQLDGSGHFSIQADVSKPEDIEKLARITLEKLCRIDILVNNAGIFEYHPLANMNYTEWQNAWKRTIDTNLIGPANLSFLVARQMIEQGGGKIINISSRGAFRGEPDAPAYGASKAGLNSFSQSLAVALAPYNIIVTAIAPGWVATDMAAPTLSADAGGTIGQSPLKRTVTPEEIANTVLFLASGEADYITGAIVDVNGASYLRN